jgi:hypothetical protein
MATVLDALNPLRNNASVAHPNEVLLNEPEGATRRSTLRGRSSPSSTRSSVQVDARRNSVALAREQVLGDDHDELDQLDHGSAHHGANRVALRTLR